MLTLIKIPSAFAFDPDAPPETQIKLAPFLTFGGNVALTYELEKNSDLDDSQDTDISTFEPGLSLAFAFDPSKNFQTFLNAELTGELEWAEGQKDQRQVKLELKEAFVLFKNLGDERFFFQIGRQRFEDDRQWLYDAELDAVGVFYLFPKLSLEFSVSRLDLVARDLLNDEPRERINNYIVYGNYTLGEEVEIGAYVLARHDPWEEGESPIFFGLHSSGEILRDLDYWLELAHVRGKEGSGKIRGIGFDVGSTYVWDLPLEPSISLGYAFGTGDDDPDDGVDKSFRQTGLQENEGEFNGVPSFKYYGELFDPELSNLSILTGGVGIKLTEESSMDLVYHY
ncbi:MAG: alginate export family protein, partial [Nitrospira sp.]|nr:alginate export family protein [Nitrospira sp.]